MLQSFYDLFVQLFGNYLLGVDLSPFIVLLSFFVAVVLFTLVAKTIYKVIELITRGW